MFIYWSSFSTSAERFPTLHSSKRQKLVDVKQSSFVIFTLEALHFASCLFSMCWHKPVSHIVELQKIPTELYQMFFNSCLCKLILHHLLDLSDHCCFSWTRSFCSCCVFFLPPVINMPTCCSERCSKGSPVFTHEADPELGIQQD